MEPLLEVQVADLAAQQAWNKDEIILMLCDFSEKHNLGVELLAYLREYIEEEDEDLRRAEAEMDAQEMIMQEQGGYPEDDWMYDDVDPFYGDREVDET